MAARTNDSSPVSSQQQHRSGRRVAFSDVSSREYGYRRQRSNGCRETHCLRLLRVGLPNYGRHISDWTSPGLFPRFHPPIRATPGPREELHPQERERTGNSKVDGRSVILTNLGTELLLNVSNKNDKVALSFGVLKANVSWEDIGLGQVTFPGFSQDPKVVKQLKITTQATNAPMNKDDVDQLKKEMKERNTVLTVVLSETVGFHAGWLQLQRLPLLIRCTEISQSALEVGQDYMCGVRIYAFG